jgi:hypothetical protein
MSPQAFGAMMSALNSFAEQLTEGGLSNFELYNKKFTIVKKDNLTFIANSSKEFNQKKINRELEKISKKFLKLYSKDLENYQGQLGAFSQFEQIIKDSLEDSILVKKEIMKKVSTSIPEDIAIKLCDEVREINSKKKISFRKGQCWGCMKFSKRNIKNRCIFSKENNRGCQMVNERFDKNYS